LKKDERFAAFVCFFAVALFACSTAPVKETPISPETHFQKEQSPAYKMGYAQGMKEAQEEINKNHLTIYTFGLRRIPEDRKDVDKETGLPYKDIAGCIVNDYILGRAAGHDDVIRNHLGKGTPKPINETDAE
jgi:hypothetical protein